METPRVQNPRQTNPTPDQPLVTDKPVTIQDAADMQRRANPDMPPNPNTSPGPQAVGQPSVAGRRHRVYMDDPTHPVDANAVPGLPLSTVQTLLRQLGDLETTVNRLPLGPGSFGMEIISMKQKLSTPGFNPTPQNMDDIHHQVQDLAMRVGVLDNPVVDPLAVTEADIDARIAEVTTTANRLREGKEGALRELQGVRMRKEQMMAPYSQANLQLLNTAILEVAKRVEMEAGRQGV